MPTKDPTTGKFRKGDAPPPIRKIIIKDANPFVTVLDLEAGTVYNQSQEMTGTIAVTGAGGVLTLDLANVYMAGDIIELDPFPDDAHPLAVTFSEEG